jgi:GTP-binding protein HflX
VNNLLPDSVFVSAITDGGLEPLKRALLARVREVRPVVDVRVPASAGRILAELHRAGEVLDERVDGDEMVVRARLDAALVGRLRSGGTSVTTV